MSFPDFTKPFLLETNAPRRGLGAVLSQKQADGWYHPIAYASRVMNETEQRYHSNKQEFLALKWAVTEQFHEYLSPYGKNRNEFVVRTDNNPLTYIFSSANLDAAGQRWVACLTCYNFSLEYQKGKDNTVADFLSRMSERLPDEEVQEYLERSHNLDRSFRNIYIIPSFPTREQHAHSVQNARSRFNKLNQSYSC